MLHAIGVVQDIASLQPVWRASQYDFSINDHSPLRQIAVVRMRSREMDGRW